MPCDFSVMAVDGMHGDGNVNNFVLFLNSFLSYLLLFVICVAVIIIAVLLGIRLRKNKDAREASIQAAAGDSGDAAARS